MPVKNFMHCFDCADQRRDIFLRSVLADKRIAKQRRAIISGIHPVDIFVRIDYYILSVGIKNGS
jgi:hypothetical protein